MISTSLSRGIGKMTTSIARKIDVAIIGTGYAGLAAAIEASTNVGSDGKIFLIDKMPSPGKSV
jgi:predicted flavoprotein YhiN